MKKTVYVFIGLLLIVFSQSVNGKDIPMSVESNSEGLSGYQMNIFIFSGKLAKAGGLKEVLEEAITVKEFEGTPTKKPLIRQVRMMFAEGLMELELESYAESVDPFSPRAFKKINWLQDHYLIRISPMEKTDRPGTARGKVFILDIQENVNFKKALVLEADKTLLALFKKGSKLLIIALQITKVEAMYHTEYRAAKFTVYSMDKSWSDIDFSADKTVFHKGRAVIHTEKGKWTLLGKRIIYISSQKKLIGEDAVLKDEGEKIVAKGRKVTISLEQPYDFKKE